MAGLPSPQAGTCELRSILHTKEGMAQLLETLGTDPTQITYPGELEPVTQPP